MVLERIRRYDSFASGKHPFSWNGKEILLKKALAFAALITGLVATGQIINRHNPVPPKPVLKQAPIPTCPPYCDKGSNGGKLVDAGN